MSTGGLQWHIAILSALSRPEFIRATDYYFYDHELSRRDRKRHIRNRKLSNRWLLVTVAGVRLFFLAHLTKRFRHWAIDPSLSFVNVFVSQRTLYSTHLTQLCVTRRAKVCHS